MGLYKKKGTKLGENAYVETFLRQSQQEQRKMKHSCQAAVALKMYLVGKRNVKLTRIYLGGLLGLP